MKWRRAVIAAVLLAVPMWVWAQTVAQDGQRTDPGRRGTGQGMMTGGIVRSDTTFKAFTMDGSGNLSTVDADRDRDFTFTEELLSLDSLRTAGDSSSVVTLNGARSLILNLKGCPKITTTSITRIAVQIRHHLNGVADSISTVPLYLMGSTGTTVSAAVGSDSVVFGHTRSGSANDPWPEEIVVYFNLARCGPNGSASSTLFYPGGIAIPLDNLFGRGVRVTHISFRFRVISGPSLSNFRATLTGTGM